MGQVIADTLSKGYQVALLLSEHLPFDIILISPALAIRRVSVKFRAATDGFISVNLRSSWSDKHGVHVKKLDTSEIDGVAVYCPEAGCFYVPASEIEGNGFRLRLVEPKNNQKAGVKLASRYSSPHLLFE